MSLAVKYRPKEFGDVVSQNSVVAILNKQLETRQFSNCYLFCGPTGVGKTTIARIFASRINEGQGEPIEIDGASNNGVDNVRMLVDQARQRSVDSEYKIFIVDECHMITIQGWNAFLKCIEEVPKYTIFIFCTTNPEKIPGTIQNRVMKFTLTKIPLSKIKERLAFICQNENITIAVEGIDYIAKLANGGMRDAIAMLEKCMDYNSDLSMDNILSCLGDFSYDSFFKITNAFIDGKLSEPLAIIQSLYDSGKDLSKFIEQYLNFTLDLTKYCLFKTFNVINIPVFLKKDLDYTTAIENNVHYFSWLTEKILAIKFQIKNDAMMKTTIEAMFVSIAQGEIHDQ